MEGWDGTTTGGMTDDVRRRWQRFGESGAKLIYGGEAMAVRAGRPRQSKSADHFEENKTGLAEIARDSGEGPSRALRDGGRSGDWLSTHSLGPFLQAE